MRYVVLISQPAVYYYLSTDGVLGKCQCNDVMLFSQAISVGLATPDDFMEAVFVTNFSAN